MLQILERLRRQGITLLIATHDLNQAAAQFGQMLLLNRRVIAYGTPTSVLTAPNLTAAYGSHLHVVHTAQGEFMLADNCCDGGLPPVETLLGKPEPVEMGN
jgi:manganese/iron transport system ATP-binding protein